MSPGPGRGCPQLFPPCWHYSGAFSYPLPTPQLIPLISAALHHECAYGGGRGAHPVVRMIICSPCPPCNRPGPFPFRVITGCGAAPQLGGNDRTTGDSDSPLLPSFHQLPVKGSGILMEPLPPPPPAPSLFLLFPCFCVCSGLNVGSMPGPASPQSPGHSLPSSSLEG